LRESDIAAVSSERKDEPYFEYNNGILVTKTPIASVRKTVPKASRCTAAEFDGFQREIRLKPNAKSVQKPSAFTISRLIVCCHKTYCSMFEVGNRLCVCLRSSKHKKRRTNEIVFVRRLSRLFDGNTAGKTKT